MINIIIIEDEIPARKKLTRFLNEVKEPFTILQEIDTVEKGIAYFDQSPSVDVIFSDIELLDGNAFEIYKNVRINCPIIFTTAYDQFWMDAFESNGIAYLIKPFSLENFLKAWTKFLTFRKENTTDIINNILQLKESYKKRFMINVGNSFHFVETQDIAYFEATEGVIFAWDKTAKKHLLSETTLKDIEGQLNPNDFFRINRSQVVQKTFIEKLERYSKNALALKLKNIDKLFITSQQNTSAFREWIEK